MRLSILSKLDLGLGRLALAVTSSWPREGKSTIALNLAAALAEMKIPVLLIDGDLRTRKLQRTLEAGDTSQPVAAQALPGVDFLAAPARPDHPDEPEISLLKGIPARYQVILIDTPALSSYKDVLLFAPILDGAVMLVSENRFQGIPEGNFSEDLRDAGIELLGLVVVRPPGD